MHILICDDSGMARKQMLRALPDELTGNVQFAENGQQVLELIGDESFDLLLLDLTMPVLDGYGTLAEIRARNIDIVSIVVSGDIQPEARQRVLSLGALAFLSKPVDPEQLQLLLADFGLWIPRSTTVVAEHRTRVDSEAAASQVRPESPQDCLREAANIAMGQAADKLARLLDAFINLPIPRVAMLDRSEVVMTLAALADGQHLAVSQGFVSRGLAAEALLSTDQQGHLGLQKLMFARNAQTGDARVGSVLDAAAILTGAFLTGIGKILDMEFSKSQPALISGNLYNSVDWNRKISIAEATLCIEIPYHFEEMDFICDLLLLFPGRAGTDILQRASHLMED